MQPRNTGVQIACHGERLVGKESLEPLLCLTVFYYVNLNSVTLWLKTKEMILRNVIYSNTSN